MSPSRLGRFVEWLAVLTLVGCGASTDDTSTGSGSEDDTGGETGGGGCEWVAQFGTDDLDAAWALTATLDGGAFAIGDYGADGFVARFDPDGTRAWLSEFGSDADETTLATAADAQGVYTVGLTNGSFDGQTPASPLRGDAFIIKHDHQGAELWREQLATDDNDELWGAAIHPHGGVAVVGMTAGTIDGQSPAFSWDVVVARYDAEGTRVWSTLLGSLGEERAFAVAADADALYVAGDTNADLGGETPLGQFDAFVARFDLDGALAWVRLLGSPESDWARDVEVRPAGGVVVVGRAGGAFAGQTSLGEVDAFVTAVSADGSVEWTRQLGSAAFDEAETVVVHASGELTVGGSTEGSVDGAPVIGSRDVFVTRLNADGETQWTRIVGTDDRDDAPGMTLASDDHVWISGGTRGSFDGAATNGTSDAYVMRLCEQAGAPAFPRP